MTPEAFAYWLRGALELNPEMLEKGMTPEQVQTVEDHLNLVLTKVTPDRFEEKTKIDTPDVPGVIRNVLEIDEEDITYHPFPGSPGGSINNGAGGYDINGDVLYC